MLDGMPVLPRRPGGSMQLHKEAYKAGSAGQWQQSFIDLTRDWLAEGDNDIDGPCRLRRQASASGAFVKFYPGSSGSSRLVHASRHGWDSAIEFLLDHGAAVNAVDGKDNTALIWAALSGRARAAVVLLDRGARIESRNSLGNTALHYAARVPSTSSEAITNGRRDLCKLLTSRGAALDAANGAGEDPEAAARARLASFVSEYRVAAAAAAEAAARARLRALTSKYLDEEDLTGEESEEDEEELREEADAALVRLEAQRSVVDLLADVRAAGGWKPYVRAPRVELVRLRSLCDRGRAAPPSTASSAKLGTLQAVSYTHLALPTKA